MEKGDLELREVSSMYMAPENKDLELGEVNIIQGTVHSLLDCVQKVNIQTNMFSPSIYMAPRTLRDLNPSLFNPRVVSIGPLHREDENVQAFEGRKANYLSNLMSSTNSPPEEILNSCVEKVYASLEQIKACYVWTKTYGDAEITKMMVMDACFILGFSREMWMVFNKSYFGDMLLIQNVIYDLVLLENQIPFFVLDAVFQCTVLKFMPEASLVDYIDPILRSLHIFDGYLNTDNIPTNTTQHILSLLHQCYEPPTSIKPGLLYTRIQSAVDLERAGVHFKPNENSTWMMGMEVKLYRFPCFFGPWGKPTLRIPKLIVENFSELVLRNLIAYEQSCQTHYHITSYVFTMDMLVNTQEDVARLVNSRVLDNRVGSNEEAADIINNICKDVAGVYSFYEQEWEKLNKYCNNYWPKNIAWLRRTYFSNPWNIIALLAGIILFALTVLQTIFTINP
ncbi:hypothetical protein HanRHA438_Chr01g0021371 [Helianthus annuus]|nr:hypothetical protein HanHA300_Chr01g0017011 [Helianthus annuus]KAJ0783185.1 hypothetical protein HanLR1_Chr01g0017471 [Helianthus annuus]KAJ0947921.1 hypothetical protein HanRHA438_Chr01g0021371 [Helianthus annuus]